MANVTAAVIGTGPEPDNIVWGESAAMAYQHGKAYSDLSDCDLVACADIVRENAADFAAEFDIDDENVFEDHLEMLRAIEPDVVSIATPVPTHADLVVTSAETGIPGAIHCEKPMAHTWSGSKRMVEAAHEYDVQLTFNHQRRFHPTWQKASSLLEDGVIGELERVEIGGKNLYDFGSHLFDLCNHFAGEREAEWVMGQIHYTEEDVRYGVHNENHGLASWSYDNGVHGIASTGYGSGADVIGASQRLVGSEGIIEIQPDGVDADVRYRNEETGGWESFELEGAFAIGRAIEHVCECLESGEQPVLSGDHALRATEIIFAVWESARQRSRIDLPLEAEGNALTELVEAGELSPVDTS
ncbi:Gfo/Idh/MocA family oxidoreductase [Natronoglomus mannanivorans]|uniref:Gfo/Idh/MocA family oxidoreductase n=1 Tax=Natronoglomus mannanivorans TaxID=2979990 RepID=A0AAP2Z091_9EURY|nr:Gfo/Idh/MocA family oxidoreductase [Halobacteria archaeon AArc-xg1-1]